jgi:nicotinate-nucleotide pyrophosphorylase (carboxylating)
MLSFDEQLLTLAEAAFMEDIGEGDHTSLACIPADAKGRAVLKIKQGGILAGLEIAEKIFRIRDPSSHFLALLSDGQAVSPGDEAFEVLAPIHTLLQCERLVLNCMQRMSGIATLTRQYVDKIRGYQTKLLDTRKTTPNFRLLEKEAVRIGGGYNHRFGLFDMILIKDNHIDYCGSIENAIERARRYRDALKPSLKIEIEARSLEELRQILASPPVERIMLDNFSPDQIREALKIVDHRAETEASGGINLENIVDFAETGVDYISVGSLIHQAKSLDISLKASPMDGRPIR